MQITENCVVSLHYTLTDKEGHELDSSSGQNPFVYLHGAHGIIPGLEKALEGKTVGDAFKVTIEPKDAYGPVNPGLVQEIPRDAFAGVEDLQAGMQFQTQDSSGQALNITVKEVNDESVEIDANHPLAGETLNFELSVEDIRPATEEEIAHGHIHP